MKKIFTSIAFLGIFFMSSNSVLAESNAPDKTGMNLTAQEWNKCVVAGWNLGNSLESAPSGWDSNSLAIGWQSTYDSSETGWGNPKTTKAMIDAVKDAGFNAVRIPVRWNCHITDPEKMTISVNWLRRVKEVVDYCIDNDMYVIINTHHDMWLEYTPLYKNQEENNKKLAALWTNIATYFSDYGDHLAFAGTNEVHIKDNWSTQTAENLAVQNSYNQTFVDAVRATGGKNSYRHLIVQTYRCDVYAGYSNFVIPTDREENGNNYMSVEFHYYNPYNYCSGNSGTNFYNYWGKVYKDKGFKTGPENEQNLINDFDRAVNTWGKKGLGIVIGEWGVSDRYNATEKESIHENMTYYCKTYVSEARKRGIATFLWDNNSFGSGSEKYGIFDRRNNMSQKATWIIKGIMEGAGQEYQEPEPTPEPTPGDDIYSKVGKTIWTGSGYMRWGDGLQLLLDASYFADFSTDDYIVFYYTLDPAPEGDNYRMIQFFFGDWQGNPSLIFEETAAKEFDLSAINGGKVEGDVYNAFQFSAADLTKIKSKGLVIQGYGLTLTRVVLVKAEALSIENVGVETSSNALSFDLFGRKITEKTNGAFFIKGNQKYMVR